MRKALAIKIKNISTNYNKKKKQKRNLIAPPKKNTIRRPIYLALVRRFSSSSLPHVSLGDKPNGSEERNPPQRGRPTFVHPSAIVHPNAILGQGVSIGPFCTVGPSVKLGNACQLYPGNHVFGNTELGDNCVLMVGAVVGDDLPGHTIIGCNNTIGHHSVVGNKCQDVKYRPGNECFLEIGDNNEIREHTSIHRSSKPTEKTVIGDNNLIMGSCDIAHDCKVGNSNIFANNTLLAGHVMVEDYAYTAGAIVVHQLCRIGSFAFVGGGSVVTEDENFQDNTQPIVFSKVSQDVPKYMMVSGERAELRGLNVEGLRRRGFSVTEIRSLRTTYRKIFMPIDANSGRIEERLDQVEQDESLASVPAVHLHSRIRSSINIPM